MGFPLQVASFPPAGSGWKLETRNSKVRVENRLEDSHAAELLVRRCRAGDAQAWEELVRQFHRRVYSICYRFAGSADAALDLTQDVFLRIYRTLDSYDPARAAFMTWVATITRNLLVDHFRKSKYDRQTDSLESSSGDSRQSNTLGELLKDSAAGPEAHLQAREAREQVHRALQKLSPELREAVILRDLQDMDYREIAGVLQVPEGTVKSRINRGRTELARLLTRIPLQAEQ
jgi:RNA polymerase sigma-70 factor (ECF subfamily)